MEWLVDNYGGWIMFGLGAITVAAYFWQEWSKKGRRK